MNTNLQTIDNMLFAGTAVAAPPVPKPNTFANTKQFSPPTDHIPASPDTPESTTADNIPAMPPNESVNKPAQDFRQALQKSQSPQQDHQDNTKPDKQDPASETDSSGTNPIQSLPAPANPITLGAYVKEAATKIEPKTEHQLAKLIANLKDGTFPPVTGQATKSDEIKLLVNTDKGQLGLKTILPEPSKGQTGLKTILPESSNDQTGLKTILPESSKGQTGLQTVLPESSNGQAGLQTVLPESSNGQAGLQTVLSNISETTPVIDTGSGQGKNADKISISNNTAVTAKTLTNSENIKELVSEAKIGPDVKTTAINEKTPPIDTPVVADSPKSPVLNGIKSETDNPVDDDRKATGINTTLTDKPAVSNNNAKTPLLNTDFSPLQSKFTEQNSQPAGNALEQSTTIANAPPDVKTTASEIPSESSGTNSKESSDAGKELLDSGKKSSDGSSIQELNLTEDLQVSADQTKINNSTAFNNNSNSELDQILTHNNPETPVAEQSSGSAEGAKTADIPLQTSLGSVSADIGKQILESIHSSLIQKGQSQQITIRLNPPELGRVFVKFQEQDDQITGLLEVSKTQTRTEIEQVLPQIVRTLQESGIQLKRLDVVLSNEQQPEQEALRDQTLQNGWAQQQGSSNSYMAGNNPDANEINEWLISSNSYQGISELQGALVTDGINMLA